MAERTEDVFVPGEYLDGVVDQDIQWIAPGRIAVGFITMLDGDPGLGKSTLLTDWAARITTGRPVLGGVAHPPAGVVLLSGEDHLQSTIKPRMQAAGADLSRVLYVNRVPNVGAFPGSTNATHAISLPSDLFYLELAVKNAEAKLVIIDPITLYFDPDVNPNQDASVRRALHSLQELAEQARFAVILVRHLNKVGQGPAVYRGTGSIGIAGAARIGMVMGQHPDNEGELVVANYKTNIGRDPKALTFRIESDTLNPAVGRVIYGDDCGLAANDLTGYVDREEREERAVCRAWLEGLLRYGPVDHKEVMSKARTAGFAATLVRSVLASMNAVKSMAGDTARWSLPYDGPNHREDEDVPWDDPVPSANGNGHHAPSGYERTLL